MTTESIWMGLSTSARSTRILAMRGPSETILKAHLSLRPSSGRAVTALFEAIALWEGVQVRAALVMDESSTSSCSSTKIRNSATIVMRWSRCSTMLWRGRNRKSDRESRDLC